MRFIRKAKRYIPASYLRNNIKFRFQMKIEDLNILKKMGFSYPVVNGERIIPNSNFNKATEINANGKEYIDKSLPKEEFPVHYNHEIPIYGNPSKGTTWVNFTIYRERYQRLRTIPISARLSTFIKDDEVFLMSDEYIYSEEINDELSMVLNIFKNTFDVLPLVISDDIEASNITMVNWEILRPGDKLESNNIVRVRFKNKREKQHYENRRDKVLSYSVDDNKIIGTRGFDGYFLVKTNKHYVMESFHDNNATYITSNEDDWEEITKLSKTEVIRNKRADRLYHNSTREERLDEILNS